MGDRNIFFIPVFCLFLSVGLCGFCYGFDFWVSLAGNDSLDGRSPQNPFRNIQRAADLAQAGDVVHIRAGVYREEVRLARSGNPGAPITFQADAGEKVVVTTTDILRGWSSHSGSVFKAPLDSSGAVGRFGMTMFVNDGLAQEAAWSDKGRRPDYLVRATFATNNTGDFNTLQDDDLNGPPDSHWKGAALWVQSHDWSLTHHDIAAFTRATGTFTLSKSAPYDIRNGDEYLVYNSLAVLDTVGEWHFDEANRQMYLWAPGGVDPDNVLVEVKRRLETFVLNGHSHIRVINLELKGGDLAMAGSSDVVLQGCKIRMPNRGFGLLPGKASDGLVLDGDGNVIRDTDFDGGWNVSILLTGSGNSIVNNHFHGIGHGNANGTCIFINHCKAGNLISHNTFNRIGRSAIGGPGGRRFVIQYNEFYDACRLTEDTGGGIYFLNSSYGNSIVHHNVFHDMVGQYCSGFYLDNMAADLVFHHNISYNTTGGGFKLNLPCRFVLVLNNTFYNRGDAEGWSPTANVSADGTRFHNNIFSAFDADFTDGGALQSGNLISAATTHWTNPRAGDFRLSANSAAADIGIAIPDITSNVTDGRPDAGALERGEAMWDYGHDFASPPNPVYAWRQISFLNVVENPSFETSLAPWAVVTGTPTLIDGNAWNYKDNALAISGLGSLELKGGDKVEQRITGLMANTTYRFQLSARLVRDLQVEAFSGSSGTFTPGVHRAEKCLQDMDAGEWLRYDGIDFGSAGRFNRVEIGHARMPATGVELRLDRSDGPLLASMTLTSDNNAWYMAGARFASTAGPHPVFLVVRGSSGLGCLDRIRFLDTNHTEKVTLGVRDFDAASGELRVDAGGSNWQRGTVDFRTGSASTSATLTVGKNGGALVAYVDQAEVSSSQPNPSDVDVKHRNRALDYSHRAKSGLRRRGPELRACRGRLEYRLDGGRIRAAPEGTDGRPLK